MKSFSPLFPIVASFVALFAAPVQAGTILPHLYAKTFCDLRSVGIDDEGARRTAVMESMISGDNWTMVKRADGSLVRSDIVLAVNVVMERCPELVK
jgi:hypothetical protein